MSINDLVLTKIDWVLALRQPPLTQFFKMAPFLASDVFYMLFIAIGHWLRPSRPLFPNLAYLVVFGTLLNCTLKNIFRVMRPEYDLHMLLVYDPFGFPSGDVQVATMFWIMIMTSIRKLFLKPLCLLPIIFIMSSRVYLGVHTPLDVIGGAFFGLLILSFWHFYIARNLFTKYWQINLFFAALYLTTIYNVDVSPQLFIALGGLFGFGLSIESINKRLQSPEKPLQKIDFAYALLGTMIMIIVAKIFPIIDLVSQLTNGSIFAKYVVIFLFVFKFVPFLR